MKQSSGISGRCSHDSGIEDTQFIAGPLGCQARCKANSKCTSFSFASSESDRCILYSAAKKAGTSLQDGKHNFVCFTKPSGFDPSLSACPSKSTCNKGQWMEVTKADGTRGRCKHSTALSDSLNADGTAGCRAKCASNSKCKAFTFATSEKNRCILYAEAKVQKSSIKDGTHNFACFNKPGGWDHSKPECSECKPWTAVKRSSGEDGRCKAEDDLISVISKVDGIEGCKEDCKKDANCKSFSYSILENSRCILFAKAKKAGSSGKDGNWKWRCRNKPEGPLCGQKKTCKPWVFVKKSDGGNGRCKSEKSYSDKQNVVGVDKCKASCEADSKCKSFSFSTKEKNRCILFSDTKKAGTSFKDNAWEWVCLNKPSAPICSFATKCNKYVELKMTNGNSGRCADGNAISDTRNVQGLSACRDKCTADVKCKSWSFSLKESNRCILSTDSKKTAYKDNNWEWKCFNKPADFDPSVPLCGVSVSKCNKYLEIKISDGNSGRCKDGNQISDTRNVQGASACRDKCTADANCKSWSFSQKESNRCILSKESKSSAFKDNNWEWACFNKPHGFDPSVPLCENVKPTTCNKWEEVKKTNGGSGRCKDGNAISDTRNVQGVDVCRTNCKNNAKCKSFSFSKKESNRCILSAESKNTAFKDHSWQWVCFNKPAKYNAALPLCGADSGANAGKDKDTGKCNKWQDVKQSNGSPGRCKSESAISDKNNIGGTDACRESCKANSKCKSFSFSYKEKNRCILFPQTKSAGSSFKDGSWEWVCFNKPADFDPSLKVCGAPDAKCNWTPVLQSDARSPGRCHSSSSYKDTQNVGSDACLTACNTDAKCKSFSFSSKEKNRCILFSNTKTKGSSFKDGSWEYQCFNKPLGGCKSTGEWTEIKQSNGKDGRCKSSGSFSDNRNVNGIPACKENCKTSSKCQSFSFASSESNRCILYSSKNVPGSSFQDGSHNFRCFNKPEPAEWVEVKQGNGKSGRCHSSGGYSDARNVAGVPGCQAKCTSDSKCESFSFASSESNRCMLFSIQKVPGSSFQDGGHNFKCYNKPIATWPEVKRYDGGTGRCQDSGAYSNKIVSNIGACQASCAGESKCKSYSFTAKGGNRCILYSIKKTGKAYLSDGGLDYVCFNKPGYSEVMKSNGSSGRCHGTGSFSDTRNVNGIPACQAKCEANKNCKSFSFASSESNRCILFSVTKGKGSSTQDGNHNFKCFNKP